MALAAALAAALAGLPAGTAGAADRPPSLVITTPARAPLPRTTPVRREPAGPPALPPAPPQGPGEVALEINEHVRHYPVRGSDLESLRSALVGALAGGGAGGSHGRTHSDIAVSYTPHPVQGGCIAQAPGLAMTITTTLPEWQAPGDADAALRARWRAMADALQAHEARHREHALDAVRDLQAALAGLGVQPDCNALRRAVDREFMRVRVRAEFRDARYDERTRNGRDEGVAL